MAPTTVTVGGKKCTPFQLQVKVFSPESGYKFIIEVQKACDSQNQPVWKLVFDLDKKIGTDFQNLVSITFVAGNANDIKKVAAISDEGMTLAQVRAFRDNVYPLTKPLADSNTKPTAAQTSAINKSMQAAINA